MNEEIINMESSHNENTDTDPGDFSMDDVIDNQFQDIYEQFEQTKIYLKKNIEKEDDLEVWDKTSIVSMKEYLDGKKKKVFRVVENHMTASFLYNLTYAFRVCLACIIVSILLSIGKIKSRTLTTEMGVVFACLSVKNTMGGSLKAIFILMSVYLGIALAVAFTFASKADNLIAIGAFIYTMSFFVSLSSFNRNNIKFYLLVFVELLLEWQIMHKKGEEFHNIKHGLEVGFTYTIGFVALFVASIIPFPFFAKAKIDKKLKVARNSIGLLLKKIAAEFETGSVTKFLVQLTEIKALVKIAEKNIHQAEELLRHLAYEHPFSSLEGYEKLIAFLKNIVLHTKGNLLALSNFSDGNAVCTLRNRIGPFAGSCASECTRSLREIFKKGIPQEKNGHLQTSIKLMRKSFKKERNTLITSIYGDDAMTFSENTFNMSESRPMKKKDQLSPQLGKELMATYFFLLQFFGIAIHIQRFQPIKPIETNFKHFLLSVRDTFLYGWRLTSKKHPKVMEYLKSKEFWIHILNAFIYSSTIFVASIFLLVPSLAKLFYDSHPTILTHVVIFIFAPLNDGGGSFNTASKWVGGSVLGIVYSFLIIEIINIKGNPYLVTLFGTLFVTLMAIVSYENKGLAHVASFITIVNLYKQKISENYESFLISSLIQIFLAVGLMLGFFSFKWIMKSARSLKRKNSIKIVNLIGLCICSCLDVYNSLGEKRVEDPQDEKGFKNINLEVKNIRSKVNKQEKLITFLIDEPILWRKKVNVQEERNILSMYNELSNSVTWLSKSAKVLSQSKIENTKLISHNIKSIITKIEVQIKVATEIISGFMRSSKYQPTSMFHPEDVMRLKRELETVARYTLRKIIEQQRENLMGNKTLSAFLSFTYILSKICSQIVRLFNICLDERVLTILNVN